MFGAAGQTSTEAGRDLGDFLNEAAGIVPKIAEAIVVLLAFCILLVALALLAVAMARRIRHASLIVRPFLDHGLGLKVGSGVATLVEERLIGAVRRNAQSSRSYDLDQVIIDVEVLAEDNDLSKAMTRLGDAPQLRLVVVVLDLLERLLPSRGLAAAGELLPPGAKGAGISLALYRGNELTARSCLWQEQVNVWFPGEDENEGNGRGLDLGMPAVEPGDGATFPSSSVGLATRPSVLLDVQHDPSPYYGLAAPAAWWVQYEAARVLDKNVSRVTTSAPSFALVGIGLTRERYGHVSAAADAYAKALVHDAANVAALVNLAQLLAREHRLYAPAILLLVRAGDDLTNEPETKRGSASTPSTFRLGDPTWYRSRYALALQCLQLATDGIGSSSAAEERGWPTGISSHSEEKWKQGFGPEVQGLLDSLFTDRAFVESDLTEPGRVATEEAMGLILAGAWALDDAGWHWVGRRPPRYLLWLKRRSLRWIRSRPPAGDRRLARFLSEVVEPSAVVLLCSSWIAGHEEFAYRRIHASILDARAMSTTPLDRRMLKKENEREWVIAYLTKLLSDGEAVASRRVRLAAWLGFTRFRPPKPPHARVRYNLACLFSRLAGEADRRGESPARKRFVSLATSQLEKALSGSLDRHRDQLAEWAQTDPGLRSLRELNKRAFSSLVARWGPHERRLVRRIQLDSSVIASAAFDDGARILELEFVGGARYQYFDVPRNVYTGLISSKSPGKFFRDKIAGQSAYVRL